MLCIGRMNRMDGVMSQRDGEREGGRQEARESRDRHTNT